MGTSMIFPESYFFISVISGTLIVPISIAVRTLLGMKEHVIVPLLRVRTSTGHIHTIIYQRIPSAAGMTSH
jgi:hypothetical protein